MPLVRRLPKRGFHSLFGTTLPQIVNVGALAPLRRRRARSTRRRLERRGLVEHGAAGVKLLGEGDAAAATCA